MTPAEAQARCKSLEQALRDKGYVLPEVSIFINWMGEDMCIKVESRTEEHSLAKSDFFRVGTEEGFEPLLAKAEHCVANVESIADAKKADFIRQVAMVIDQGREIGMEVEFLNPLTDMMKKLSENILTCS